MTPQLSPSGFFVLRTPLLPYEELAAWGDGLSRAGGGDISDRQLAADRTRLRRRLQALVQRPDVREALFLGSPDLEGSLDVWLRDPDSERGTGIERALVRYLVRMASRPTPFGLFAGVSSGRIGQRTTLTVDGRDRYRRHTRVDTSCLVALARDVATAPGAERHLALVPNPLLYRWAGGFRWARSCSGAAGGKALMALPGTALLRSALALAAGGTTAEQLAAALAAGGGPAERAHRFVDELVALEVLVPALGVVVTGREPIEALVEQLEASAPTSDATRRLRGVADGLAELDGAGLGAAPERYHRLARMLAEAGAAGSAGMFHVDLVKAGEGATLGGQVLDEIRRGVALLHRISRPRPPGDLDRFRDAFERRYEGREVPLLEALDGDAGVGFGPSVSSAPLLTGLTFPAVGAGVTTTHADELLLARLLSAAGGKETEVVLDGADVDAMATGAADVPLPGAFAVLASVEAAGQEALDRGDFRVFVRAMGGPSGAWLLGRFCHADATIRAHVEDHLRSEEAQDGGAVWAEVAHLPDGAYANVVVRPVLRPYEIPCFGRSGAPDDRQLALDDLLVSLVGGRVVLRSRRLGRRVIPRITTAHDFARPGPPAYRFLAALQVQGVTAGLTWTWGALTSAPFLPRVRHGRVVLSLARWNISRAELGLLRGLSAADLVRHLHRWRSQRGIPRLVSLADGDATLLVDFENVLSAESFAHLVRGRDHAVVEEVFPSPDRLCATGPDGSFLHELVVPFLSSSPPPSDSARPEVAASVRRSFPPGSDWVSAKLYAGPSTVDGLLRDVIEPLRRELLGSGRADGWFFVRYGDPNWHLRARFHAGPAGDGRQLLDGISGALAVALDSGRVWRLQLDTYEREVERYGGAQGMALAEEMFAVDSDAVMELLHRIPKGDAGAEDRWMIAMRGVDQLLDDLGLLGAGKLAVLKRGRDIYAREHRVDGRLEEQLSRRFRTNRPALEALLEPAATPVGALGACVQALRERSLRIAPLAAALRALEREGELSCSVEDLATSYVHLHLNRVLASAHRAQELVVYDSLLRLHRSRTARQRPAER